MAVTGGPPTLNIAGSIAQPKAPTTSGIPFTPTINQFGTAQNGGTTSPQAAFSNPTTTVGAGGLATVNPTPGMSTSTSFAIPKSTLGQSNSTFPNGTPISATLTNTGSVTPMSAPLNPLSTLEKIKQQALQIQAQAPYATYSDATTGQQAKPDLTGVGTTSNLSANQNTTSYQDILQKIKENQDAYLQAGQKSQQEVQAEQQLLDAVRNQQNAQKAQYDLGLQIKGNQMQDYGQGVALGVADANYNRQSFNSQIAQSQAQYGVTQAQNQQDLAQRSLGYEQTNRQINAGVQQNLLSNNTALAGQALTQQQQQQQFQLGQQQLGLGYAQLSAPYQGMTADQQAQLGLQYYQQTGQFPNFGGGGALGGNDQSTIGSTSLAKNNFLGYDLSTYATDPNYANKLTPILQNIQSNVSTFGPQGMDQYIKSIAPNSPITGQMVYNASSSAGVDPRVMLSMLQLESQFGTKGAATSTMNPGNVGNTDSGKKTAMPSWDAGVTAMAQQLANRHINAQQSPSAPSVIQPALGHLSDGTTYINKDKVPSQSTLLAQNYSAQTGIPMLTGEEVGKVQNLDLTTQSLAQIGNLIPQLLGSGLAGRIQGLVGNQLQNFLQSNPQLSSFQDYRTAAINTIQALAGGSGSGFRLNEGEIKAATDNLPTITDNLETAQSKLAIMQSFVNKWKNELLPNQSSPSSPQSSGQTQTYNGGTYQKVAGGWQLVQ